LYSTRAPQAVAQSQDANPQNAYAVIARHPPRRMVEVAGYRLPAFVFDLYIRQTLRLP
jgi:hypothetical protein